MNVPNKRITIIIILLVVFTSNVFSLMHSPSITPTIKDESINISIISTNLFTSSDITLSYRKLNSDWINLSFNSYSYNSLDNNHVYTFNIPLLSREGVYEYYILDKNSNRFPLFNGTKKFSVSGVNELLINKSLSFINDDQTTSFYCQPSSNNFNCKFAHFHSAEALRFAYAYYLTKNISYYNTTLNLSFSVYHDHSTYTTPQCDHSRGDFNCDDISDDPYYPLIKGPQRQGTIISDFSKIYLLTKNKSILNHAISYANGNASDCNVWASDFKCGNSYTSLDDSLSQGSMIEGYWNIFEVTGDLLYKFIAINLTREGLFFSPSPKLGIGFAKAYELTGNNTYFSMMNYIAQNLSNYCLDNVCSSREKIFLSEMYFEVYLQTGNLNYLYNSLSLVLEDFSGNCNLNSLNLNCTNSEDQGKLNSNLFKLSLISPKKGSFIMPHFQNKVIPTNPVSFSFFYYGIIQNPVLYIKSPLELEYKSISLSYLNKSINLNDSFFLNEGRYSLFLNSSNGVRYPLGNSTFDFIVSNNNEELLDYNLRFLEKDAFDDFCGINKGVYQCRREHSQGFMISNLLFQNYLNRTTNYFLNTAKNFSYGRIDPTGPNARGTHSTCEYVDNDFYCEDFDLPSLEERSGSIRQSFMILSSLENYLINRNETFRLRAVNYLESPNSNCDVWNNEFDCRNESDENNLYAFSSLNSHGMLMYSYWKAYKILGDNKYKEIATHLANDVLSYTTYSEAIALGLYEAYSVTSNSTYLTLAHNITQDLSNDCFNNDCNPEKYAYNQWLLWESLEHIPVDDIPNIQNNAWTLSITNYPNSVNCNYYTDNYECNSAYLQALMSHSYAKGAANYHLVGNESYFIAMNISSNLIDYNTIFNLTCSVKNNGSIDNGDFYLYLRDILSLSILNVSIKDSDPTNNFFLSNENKTIEFENLKVNDTINITWNFNATYGGFISPRCIIAPDFKGEDEFLIDNIYDVLDFDIPNSIFINTNNSSTHTFKINNSVNFNLHNLTINFNILKNKTIIDNSSIGHIINITSSNPSVNINLSNNSIFLEKLNLDTNLDLNFTFNFSVIDDFSFMLSTNTTYGGYINKTINLYSYDNDVYSYSLTAPSISNVKEEFLINLTLKNNRKFNISNLLIGFKKNNLSYFNLPSCSNCSVINHSHVIFNLSSNETKSIIFSAMSNKTGNFNYSFSGLPLELIPFNSSIYNISIYGNTFNLSSSGIPSILQREVNHDINFSFNLTNIIDLPLYNISIKLDLPSTSSINIKDVNLNKTIINKSYVSPFFASDTNTSLDITNVLNSSSLLHNFSLNNSFRIINLSFKGLNLSNLCTLNNISLNLKGLVNGSGSYELFDLNNNSLVCKKTKSTESFNDGCVLANNFNFTKNELNFSLNFSSDTNFNVSLNQASLLTSTNCIKVYDGIIISPEEVLLHNLSSLEERTIFWSINTTPSSAESFNIIVESIEGGYGKHPINFQVTNPVDTNTGGGSSGGGGIAINRKEFVYDYTDYNLSLEIDPYPVFYSYTNYTKNYTIFSNKSLFNITHKLIPFIKIKRIYVTDNKTVLNINNLNPTSNDLNWSTNISYFSYFDIIPKGLVNNFSFYSPSSATYKIFSLNNKSDIIFFNISIDNVFFNYNITYLTQGFGSDITSFKKPIWFSDTYFSSVVDIINESEINNSFVNETNITEEDDSKNPILDPSLDDSKSEDKIDEKSDKGKKIDLILSSKSMYNSVKNFIVDKFSTISKFFIFILCVVLLYFIYRLNFHKSIILTLKRLKRRFHILQKLVDSLYSLVDYMSYLFASFKLNIYSRSFDKKITKLLANSSSDTNPQPDLAVDVYLVLKSALINFANGKLSTKELKKIRSKITSKDLLNEKLIYFIIKLIDDILNYESLVSSKKEESYDLSKLKYDIDKRLALVNGKKLKTLPTPKQTQTSPPDKKEIEDKAINSFDLLNDFYFELNKLSSFLDEKDFKKAKHIFNSLDSMKSNIENNLTSLPVKLKSFYKVYLLPKYIELKGVLDNADKKK
jgi:hypothetical protein